MIALLPALSSLLACAPPFQVSRKDLGPFRIAAIGVHDGVAHAAVWSGEGMHHEQSPELDWTLDGMALGQGYQVSVPREGTLALTARAADGTTATAQVSVVDTQDGLSITRGAVELGEDLSLSARAALSPSESEGGESAVRVSVSDARGALRWMSAMGLGTVLELSEHQADVLADEVEFENEEGAWVVAERTPGEPGVYSQLVLDLDAEQGNRWEWCDVALGVDTPLLQHRSRLLPVDVQLQPGLVALTLSLETGQLRYLDPAEVLDLSEQDALECALSGVPFELSWLVEGRCGMDELQDARVVLETR